MTDLPLIGLVGYKGAGKDSVAAVLVREYGYTRHAFADALKEEVWRLAAQNKIGQTWYTPEGWRSYCEAHKYDPPDSPSGWPRLLLQAWGMMRRDLSGEDYWVRKLPLGPGVVVSDVRFPNEAEAIRDAGGRIWWVPRPGCGPDGHASEQLRITSTPADVYTENSGTLDDLAEAVRDRMRRLLAPNGTAMAP